MRAQLSGLASGGIVTGLPAETPRSRAQGLVWAPRFAGRLGFRATEVARE